MGHLHDQKSWKYRRRPCFSFARWQLVIQWLLLLTGLAVARDVDAKLQCVEKIHPGAFGYARTFGDRDASDVLLSHIHHRSTHTVRATFSPGTYTFESRLNGKAYYGWLRVVFSAPSSGPGWNCQLNLCDDSTHEKVFVLRSSDQGYPILLSLPVRNCKQASPSSCGCSGIN